MHTAVVTLVGFAILGVFIVNARCPGASVLNFIPVWLVLCLIHLEFGIFGAGYSLGDELGIHAIVFGLPAVTGWFLSRKFSLKN